MIVTCRQCKQDKNVNATPEQITAWHSGALIQHAMLSSGPSTVVSALRQSAMPNVPADERELLISGICGPCFDAMFREED